MQSKCTCKSADHHHHHPQHQQQHHQQSQQNKSQTSSTPPPLTSQSSNTTTEKDIDKEPLELCDICRYHRLLPQLNSMPDMLFNNNLLRLEHSCGVGVEFNPLDALRLVEETKDPLRVAVADGWQSARADCPFAKNVIKPFDWTFTSSYRGTLLSAIKKSQPKQTDKQQPLRDELHQHQSKNVKEGSQSEDNSTNKDCNDNSDNQTNKDIQSLDEVIKETNEINIRSNDETKEDGRLDWTVEETEDRIDVNKLKVREEILFYDDVTLYEDELADHGTAQYSVKVRVMPSSLFILARYYLRIDGVLARINDTRIYHDLSERHILREYSNREAKLSSVNLPVSTVINPSELMNHLPLIHSKYEKLIIPKLK